MNHNLAFNRLRNFLASKMSPSKHGISKGLQTPQGVNKLFAGYKDFVSNIAPKDPSQGAAKSYKHFETALHYFFGNRNNALVSNILFEIQTVYTHSNVTGMLYNFICVYNLLSDFSKELFFSPTEFKERFGEETELKLSPIIAEKGQDGEDYFWIQEDIETVMFNYLTDLFGLEPEDYSANVEIVLKMFKNQFTANVIQQFDKEVDYQQFMEDYKQVFNSIELNNVNNLYMKEMMQPSNPEKNEQSPFRFPITSMKEILAQQEATSDAIEVERLIQEEEKKSIVDVIDTDTLDTDTLDVDAVEKTEEIIEEDKSSVEEDETLAESSEDS